MSNSCQHSTKHPMEKSGTVYYNIVVHLIGKNMRKYFKYIKTQRRKTVVADYNRQEKTLFILLDEEIDQDTVDKIKRNIDDEIERYIPRKVVFDFSNITFMDSSGIGMLLGRYKLIKLIDAEMEIDNVSRSIKRIFDMSGIERIIKITSKKEEEGNNERAM